MTRRRCTTRCTRRIATHRFVLLPLPLPHAAVLYSVDSSSSSSSTQLLHARVALNSDTYTTQNTVSAYAGGGGSRKCALSGSGMSRSLVGDTHTHTHILATYVCMYVHMPTSVPCACRSTSRILPYRILPYSLQDFTTPALPDVRYSAGGENFLYCIVVLLLLSLLTLELSLFNCRFFFFQLKLLGVSAYTNFTRKDVCAPELETIIQYNMQCSTSLHQNPSVDSSHNLVRG